MNQNQGRGNERELLIRFEPVVCYTRGERFFPMDIERYIAECSLWVQCPDESAELLVPEGELTLEKLTQPHNRGFGAVYYLKLIEPLDLVELAKYSFNQAVKTLTGKEADLFRAGRGRLARVGYASRLVDALFSITLFLRGRVPGDTAAAAALTYQRLQAENERYCYYGRITRQGGWVILQYWYFYPFNNWRSGFFGVNDHEGDWEMITIYCSEQGEGSPTLSSESFPASCIQPQWVAYASHDFSGDDLRRRWDDPEVEKVFDRGGGEHPVIYAGAGSHASYFSRGEYLAELELPFLDPLARLVAAVRGFWQNQLRQFGAKTNDSGVAFSVPFVDYARGDGIQIGPGGQKEWQCCVLDQTVPWAMEYRGLWGLYASDPISGENAPAGPVYNRDGSVRRSWSDPLGWAGLDKVSPPETVPTVLFQQRIAVQKELRVLEEEIEEKSNRLMVLGVETSAMKGHPHLEQEHDKYVERMAALSDEVYQLRNRQAVAQAKLEAFDQYSDMLQQGYRGPMRAHIHRGHKPSPKVDLRLGSLAEIFAALSTGLVMVGIVLLIIFARHYLVFGLSAMVGLLIFLEAGFRRRLSRLITSLVIGLAVISAFILIFEFFWQIVSVGVIAAGLYLMWENLREIAA